MAELSTSRIIKVRPPQKREIYTIRLLIGLAALCMLSFVYWFADREHIGYGPIFWLLTFALIFKLVKMIHEWYHYWNPSIPKMPVSEKKWTVDVLTTACPGEPKEMIIRTLRAMAAITYPHTNYLCDEGDVPELKQVCRELGVVHVTRKEKINAKAGNINNALKQATGEICVVLDPDHVPIPEFLDRVLAYFEDPAIGFVQCVQAYGNQSESLIALGAAEQTYHFYGPMMMTMNSYGTVQAIGANCTFRRTALDSIGGHAAGLSEDMHTAMQLHAKGWKSVYVPEVLSRGLVPATLSSYYKQQLKWSRGTFELLFRTYPELYKNFTWRQKIHYFTIPLYFLFGLINLIDIAIPVAALALAEVPWAVDLGHFAVFFIPLCTLSMLIRLYAQRWLLEKHERGFHLAGGLLRTATWWIFLIGFIYTIFKVKVPYIPTPKEDKHENYWGLSIPNLAVAFISFIAIIYGLSIDWTPYSMAMAFYALLNSGMLAFIVMMSQQRLVLNIRESANKVPALCYLTNGVGYAANYGRQVVYNTLRNGPVAILAASSLLFLSYSSISESEEIKSKSKQKDFGGFYTGMNIGGELNRNDLAIAENRLKSSVAVFAIDQQFSQEAALPLANMQSIDCRTSSPLLNWFPVQKSNDSLYLWISSGKFDNYLKQCADNFRTYKEPVFVNFAPGFDDPANSWSVNNTRASEFVAAWQYLYTFFNNLGISNLTWVWSPKNADAHHYYPGPKFVDWIGLSCLNYGESKSDKDYYTFSELYKPYRDKLGAYQKPVLVTEFGSLTGPDQKAWIAEALSAIQTDFREIKGLVFYNRIKEINYVSNGKPMQYRAEFIMDGSSANVVAEKLQDEPFNKTPFFKTTLNTKQQAKSYTSPFLKGTPGHYTMMIHGEPFYIRGVAYNTAHDWRDGNMPLTRKQVEMDFSKIRAMGANTIRRYDHGIYDRNVLNIAEEYGLNVQYGFWFDPKIDYYRDTAKFEEYLAEVEEKVLEYRDHPAVVAWSLGNETWGLLKHSYSKPYLTKVRAAYVSLVERLAQRIHELDPGRPVFSSMEHEEYQLPGELVAFRDGAPSVDVIGVNSYYREQISHLNHVVWEFDSLRPYLVSEFGPRGYWDPTYNKTSNGSLIEDTETEKASWYREQWTNYVAGNRGYNIGGFAYCWHDRMEGSYTWFGLTDFKGRPKPSYYALKELWTREPVRTLPDVFIDAPKTINPGQDYVFAARSLKSLPEGYEYEWYLLKDEFLERVDNIETGDDGRSITLHVPEEHSDYRLYLYVSDPSGNVTTASVPVKVL